MRASEDKYATDELTTDGELSTTTQIRRAESKGDTQRKAELVENMESSRAVTDFRAEYQSRYKTDALAEPHLAEIDSTAAFLKHNGDSRPLSEIKASVADEMQSSHELRVANVKRYGVKSERSPELEYVLQKDVEAKQHSESHQQSEDLGASLGLNVGTNNLVQAQLANQDDMFTERTGPYGTGPRQLKAGIDREQFTRGDNALTKSLDLQRAEKIKHAERLASTFTTIAKIGALLVAQPGLVMLIDLGANLGGMAIKGSAGGSDVDLSADKAMLAVDLLADALGVGVAVGSASKAINAERAVQSAAHVAERTAEDVVEHGVTAEAKAEIVGAGAKAAAGESHVLSKELAAVSDTGIEGGASHLAKAEIGALALADRKVASQGVSSASTAVSHSGLIANLGVNSFGSVLGGAVQGESSDDILIGLARMLGGSLLPGRLAGWMQKAIGTGSKAQRMIGAGLGTAANMGANFAISGDSRGSLINGVHSHVAGHANAHGGDERYAPVRMSHDDGNPLAHYADDPAHPAARPHGASDGPEVVGPHAQDEVVPSDNAHGVEAVVPHTSMQPHVQETSPASPRNTTARDRGNPDTAPVAQRSHPADDSSSLGVTTPQEGTNEHKRILAKRMQDLANEERAARNAKRRADFTAIDQLAGGATSSKDWEAIRGLEHEAKRPVSERYSLHDELAAIQQYERVGGLHHADGTPMNAAEAKAWIASAKSRVQHGIETKTKEHHDAVADLTRELTDRIATRDADKTRALVVKVKAAPLDDIGRRVVTVDEAISLGMGGAGASGAKHGHSDSGGDPVTRTDRMGIEDTTKPELWGTLRDEPAGQEANAISYGNEGLHTKHIAEHPTAQVAKASELALQVASQRNDSQVGTIGTNGPIGELQFKRVELPDGRAVLEVGVPVKMQIDGVEQVVIVTTIKGVDVASGMGQARKLTTEKTADARSLKQIEHDTALSLQGDALMTGEQALATDASHFKGKRVLGIGGGPVSVWAAEHAVHGEAASVEIVGRMPRPDATSTLGTDLSKVEAEIRALVESGKEVPLEKTQEHHQIVDAHIESQLNELDKLDVKLKTEPNTDEHTRPDGGTRDPEKFWKREKALAEQAKIKNDLDAFLGSRVDRNHASLNNDKIKRGQADIMSVKALKGGEIEIVFTDGTRTVVDKVIPSIGQDHNQKGGVDAMLKGLPIDVKMIPVIAQGRVVGLVSDPPGLSISGAALTGTIGTNMPKQLLSRIPPEMRDAFLSSVVDHANRRDVSDDSRGIIPGIENVGQNPALMQQALKLPAAEREEALRDFLDKHQETREEQFDGNPRFSL